MKAARRVRADHDEMADTEMPARFATNDIDAEAKAVLAGLGICQIPNDIAASLTTVRPPVRRDGVPARSALEDDRRAPCLRSDLDDDPQAATRPRRVNLPLCCGSQPTLSVRTSPGISR
jgi:hypothetical protein